jgi:hypothetical protein
MGRATFALSGEGVEEFRFTIVSPAPPLTVTVEPVPLVGQGAPVLPTFPAVSTVAQLNTEGGDVVILRAAALVTPL